MDVNKLSIPVPVEKIHVRLNTRKMVKESVALEAPVNIFINNYHMITLLATPSLLKELALGQLFNEGVLQSLNQVKKVIVEKDNVDVITKHPIDDNKLHQISLSKISATSSIVFATSFSKSYPLIKSNYRIGSNAIIKMARTLDEGTLYRLTGGLHVGALFEEERLVAFAEDVGRHNSIDKVVGISVQSNVNFSKSVLVSSGRQPANMVRKAVTMRIPIIVSIAAPIHSGITAADKAGITLVCFVKTQKMNVYTHPFRILTP